MLSLDTASTSELRDRVARLEILVENLAGVGLRGLSDFRREGVATEPFALGCLTDTTEGHVKSNQLLGRQVFDSGSSVYVDPSAWSELFERV